MVPSQVCPAARDVQPPSPRSRVIEQILEGQVVVGVDTHDLHHVAMGVDNLGRRLGSISVATCPAGYRDFLEWAMGLGDIAAVAMEGIGSYGRGRCALLQAQGIKVVEVARPSRRNRRNRGKADVMDAESAARAYLGGEVCGAPWERCSGSHDSIAASRPRRSGKSANSID